MKKLIFALAMVAVPAFASASTGHYAYYNSQPAYPFDLYDSNVNQQPFGVTCALSGFNKNRISWEENDTASNIKNATYAQPVYGYTMPVVGTLHTSWFGTDVATTTLDASRVTVKYLTSGAKAMYVSVTDGNMTEVRKCGDFYVDMSPAGKQQTITLENGVQLTY